MSKNQFTGTAMQPQCHSKFCQFNKDQYCTHRHLGVVLSNNAKWNAHIDSIYTSCMKKVNVMRKLKCKLNIKKSY